MNRAKLIPLDHYWTLLLSVHLYSPLKAYITVQRCQTLSVSTFSFCYHPRLSDPMSNHIPTHRDESILRWFDQTSQGPDRLFLHSRAKLSNSIWSVQKNIMGISCKADCTSQRLGGSQKWICMAIQPIEPVERGEYWTEREPGHPEIESRRGFNDWTTSFNCVI